MATPSKMRAVQYSSTKDGLEKNIRINETASLPKTAKALPKHAVLVKIAYSSLNPVDVKVPESLLGALTHKPAIPASDFAGTVIESNIDKVRPGDTIFGFLPLPSFGALAEYAVVTGKDSINKVPSGLSLSDASTLGVAGLTAWQSIAPFVTDQSRVLINGASGGVGTFQIQFAKYLGCHVTAVCSGANAELCRSLGADEVIDYKTTNVIEYLKKHSADECAFDLITDNIFMNPDLFWQAHHYLNKAGKFTTIAGRPSFDFVRAVIAISLPAFLTGRRRAFQVVICKENEGHFEKIASLVASGAIRPSIERIVELEEIVGAYERLKSGRTRGKIVVKVSKE